MLKRLTGTEKMSITPHTSSNCINMYIIIVIPSAGTDAKNLAMNLKTLTEASHLISTCDVGTTAPGVGTPCLPAHVSFLQNLIFNTVGRRYSRSISILRSVPLMPAPRAAGMDAPPRGEPYPRGGGGSPPRPALWGGGGSPPRPDP